MSGFGGDVSGDAPFAVDFDAATPLGGRSGSTCDAYECVVQRRRVFVKRLKAEYRDNPLYRAAFDKEFDLGVSLSHPSLPRYVGFGGDYIVMDFVEGDTLADLIERGDNRLKDKKFVKRLLRELIDVVDYLHNRNIVHCDIKADNVVISPYPDRPATLIDFDKAYSPWLDSTHGNAANYGCDDCADGGIDFKGIGLIANRLGMKRFGAACAKGDASANSLRQSLAGKSLRWIMIVSVAIVVGASALTMLWHRPSHADAVESPASDSSIDVRSEAVAAPDTVYIPQTVVVQPVDAPKPAIDKAWIGSVITKHLGDFDAYRLRVLDTVDCDTLTIWAKKDAVNRYTLGYLFAAGRVIADAVAHYGNMPEVDVQRAVRSHPEWVRFEIEYMGMEERLAELNASKRSQRSSGRPASLPDTTQGDSLPAQHR